uniref:Secreted protein n=1 Tax=Trichobilharzia regenti TaxID=157069 RepID=A0AA85IY83_TRIRE|nr:unnamed protein product [Trichobilharzia regenti]
MLNKICLTAISSVVLYVMHLPVCESGFIWGLLCEFLGIFCDGEPEEVSHLVNQMVSMGSSSSVSHYYFVYTTSVFAEHFSFPLECPY